MEIAKILNKRVGGDIDEQQVKSNVYFQGIAFYLGKSLFCMDIMSIRDIIAAKKIYKVPNTTDKLLGTINLRGEILPVYSLKLVLSIPDNIAGKNIIEEEEDKFIITVKKDRDIFGIFVDAIYKNMVATEENYREGNYLQKWSKNYLFNGVLLDEDNEILVLNIENLLRHLISLK